VKTYAAFVGLGSNLGDRLAYLNDAARALRKIRGTRLIWCSQVYEADPYGKTDQPKFLNAAAELETELRPEELLPELKSIEERLGRKPGEHWGPREIDIDILVYDGLVVAEQHLKVPHPDLENRRFALITLREIAPDLVHPVNGMTISELAAVCPDRGRVMPTSYRIKL
jgi:2-amino-4-hydroxy-6-hydroxymethyldihydropteridine diphosphokinase